MWQEERLSAHDEPCERRWGSVGWGEPQMDCRTLWKVLAKPMGCPLAEDARSRTPTWAGVGQH